MILYNSIGPNPRLVRLFAAEKGVPLSLVEIDILAGENRQADYLAINLRGTTPVLELEGGHRIAETTAICEYLEERFPAPALIGSTALERAYTRMWYRRVDQMIVQPMTTGFRGAEGLDIFKNRVECYPEVAGRLKKEASDGWRWLEANSIGTAFICGRSPTLVDLLLLCFADFGEMVGQGIPQECQRLHIWVANMRNRCADYE